MDEGVYMAVLENHSKYEVRGFSEVDFVYANVRWSGKAGGAS